MDHPRPTLRGALVPDRPFVPCHAADLGNTKSAAWPTEVELRPWLAFNIHALNESYGHVLDGPMPTEVAAMMPSTAKLQGLAVVDDDGPKRIIAWNDERVMPLVKYAKQAMHLHPGALLRHDYEKVGDAMSPAVPGLHRQTTIGHVIALGNHQSDVLVVGLSRTSTKWKGSTLIKNPRAANKEQKWPIRQLANLCAKTGTRYGYIQTDEELVACCFSATNSGGTYSDWKVLAMSVPWNMEVPIYGHVGVGSSLMSAELALWWLCMLSMSDANRAIVEEKDIVPIDKWEPVHHVDKNAWVQRHPYSGFEKPAPPPAAPDPFFGFDFDLGAGF